MSSETKSFRSAMFGYNKSDVDSYVERVESELEIQQTRYAKLEQQVGQLLRETDHAKTSASEKSDEARKLMQQNTELRQTIRDLEAQIKEKDQLHSRIQEENRLRLKEINDSGADPKAIQEAILNAQRMSSILMDEAKLNAQEIRHQAELDREAAQDSSRQILEQAHQKAEDMIQSAQLQCDNLQRDYDQVLMDVTLFKTKLLQMYREHMERLLALPEKEPLKLEYANDAEIIEDA